VVRAAEGAATLASLSELEAESDSDEEPAPQKPPPNLLIFNSYFE